MEILDFLKKSQTYSSQRPEDYRAKINIKLVSNFTDDLIKKVLTGMCLSEGVYPIIEAVPYKQYHFQLNDHSSNLFTSESTITFIIFDYNSFTESEFNVIEHFESTLKDLEAYCVSRSGIVVINNFLLPYELPTGPKGEKNELWEKISKYNAALEELSSRNKNVYLLDTSILSFGIDTNQIRDLRNLFAFDVPYGNTFIGIICKKWMKYVRDLCGLTKKCIVVDLDNTLWGGIVGEVGPHGISLGHEYPGNAYRSFQNALLHYYKKGILLAINSKNNLEDVREVFRENKNMLLQEEHFVAMRINWENKVSNLISISEELGIGLQHMVFIDDDPVNRGQVQSSLPEVFVPNFSIPPEAYTGTLHSLDMFDSLTITSEDLRRNEMYFAEQKRKQAQENGISNEEYIRGLKINVNIRKNDRNLIPRISQLTTKTNQFNLTTKRYTEHDVNRFIENGALIFTAEVRDEYGTYGTTNVAIVTFTDNNTAVLDSFLMSCRVIGRGVEFAFLEHIIVELKKMGVNEIIAHFIKSTKNSPAQEFLPKMGYIEQNNSGDITEYKLAIGTFNKKTGFPFDAITINYPEQ